MQDEVDLILPLPFHVQIVWLKPLLLSKSVQGYWERRTMEAIKIEKSKSSMNLDRGLDLPSVWNPVFDLT